MYFDPFRHILLCLGSVFVIVLFCSAITSLNVFLSSYSSLILGDRQRKRKFQESTAGDGKLLKDNVRLLVCCLFAT